MNAIRASVRPPVHHAIALVAAVIAIALAGPQSAFAGLMGTNYFIRYDGYVRSAGNTGTEGHSNTLPFGEDDIPPHEIPVTINPNSPLKNARVLTVLETEFLGPSNTNHVILDIKGKTSAGGPTVFVNDLDSNLAYPVQFEGHFYDNDPTKALKLDPAGIVESGLVDHDTIELENFGHFYKLPLAQKHVSGGGTINDPLKIVLDIPANMVPINQGRLKLHFYFSRGGIVVIPEPATAALVLIGLATFGAARRRNLVVIPLA